MTIPISEYSAGTKLQPSELQAASLEQLGKLIPSGVYTITRTFHKDQVVLLDAHLDRLEESARLAGIDLSIDRKDLRALIREMIEAAGYEESRIRITILETPGSPILLAIEPLQDVPKHLRELGVHVAAVSITRPNPRIKSNYWVTLRGEARAELPPEVYEGLVRTDDGTILEGFSSNIYGITSEYLQTSDSRILMGIARKIVLEVAQDLIPIRFDALKKDQLDTLEEAFLSSSGRGVVPIVKVDDIQIGTGAPGPLTREIMQRYDAWVERHLEPL
jgi:branched-subunit amino acid aminotransferase/4-amino-4-deoxychorismate lyase